MIAVAGNRRLQVRAASYSGAILMLCFAGLAGWRWSSSGLLFYLILALRDFIAAVLLLIRRPEQAPGASRLEQVASIASCAIPLMYRGEMFWWLWDFSGVAEILAVTGYALSTLAMIELGKSFGIAPANRSHVSGGIYRVMRHPMYAGYAVAEFGLVLLNPVNLLVFVPSMILYRWRARWEEQKFGRGC